VINGNSETVLTTTAIGADPFPVAINTRTNVLFVGLRSKNALIKIDDSFGQ
jgi:hypothetical protein